MTRSAASSTSGVLNSREVVAGWVERIRVQVSRFVDFDTADGAQLVNNLDWTGPMSVLDFLRDVGKHFPVNRMLARDVVRNRLEAGISYTEFSYVLLQSLDYLELSRRHGCTLQFGGSDQWGNITAGVELVRRADQRHVHALATPLLTKADGTKFGKTESGTVWLDAEMTSPFAFHQYFLNAEDAKVIDYLKVFSPRSRDEIDSWRSRRPSDRSRGPPSTHWPTTSPPWCTRPLRPAPRTRPRRPCSAAVSCHSCRERR